jgi:hypothetical protein
MTDNQKTNCSHQGAEEARRSEARSRELGPPWEIDVYVDLTSARNPPEFSIDTCLPLKSHKGDKHPWIIFNNAGRNGFTLYFRLSDQTGANNSYVFPDPPGRPGDNIDPLKWALWSQQGQTCPTSAGQWPQFTALRVEDDGSTLVVQNLNEYQADFYYTLRVTNDGEHFVNLDPGGTNNNSNILRW